MRSIIGAIILNSAAVGLCAAAPAPAPAPAKVPSTTQEFIARCKTDPNFCRIQIQAAETLLERNRKVCPPGRVTKDAMAERVRDVVEDVLEEDPATFNTAPYRETVDQIISYLWPCEPIS